MGHPATLRGLLWLPYSAVADIDVLRQELTFQPRRRMDGEKRDPVLMYYDIPDRGVVGVPPSWGLDTFGHVLDVVDETSQGEEMNPGSKLRKPDPNHPAVKDPKAQAKFITDMEHAVTTERRFLAKAPTGTGKTVVGAWVACMLGRKTLVMSHLDRINAQWVEAFANINGIPMDRIGEMQGGKRSWRDKDVVIGTYQTIGQEPGRFPKEFYNGFGTVICDEVHRCGAPMFSQAIWQFPAAVRIGLTATDERKDGADCIVKAHLGDVAVTSQQAALPMQVWPVWFQSNHKLWGDNHGSRVKCLTTDWARNQRIVELIKRMHDNGRQAIIVGEAVKHLQMLMEMCVKAGIPKQDMGQFTAEVHGTVKVKAGDRWQEVKRNKKQTAGALERVKRESQLIFATYGMIKEGIDIPRLDAGIDVTPRSDATQLIGRIRRPHPGKRQPVLWVTLVDTYCDRSLRYYQSRLAEYEEAGAEVVNRA